jgi:hypothetical protein
MPVNLKEALLNPLLKKASLDSKTFKNFRPVSNLAYISKIVEKVVDNCTTDHMALHNLHDEFQSAYRKFHSTETALLRLHNDIMQAIDNKEAVALVLLDLSAAFDTVDHQILLNRLSSKVGIRGSVLAWFKSYLSDHSQKVIIKGSRSSSHKLNCGVPQGSILGPKRFSIYIIPLGEIIQKHG